MFFYSEPIEEIIQQIILNQWIQSQTVTGSATYGGAGFGYSVALNSDGSRMVVGAEQQSLAYVFVSGSSGWKQQHILSGSLVDGAELFGYSVDINSSGDRIVVSAPYDEKAGGADGSGLAYVFVSSSNGWSQQHILSGTLATHTEDFFGYSVAINSTGDRIIVGATYDERVNQTSTQDEGLAYIFVSGTSGWIQQSILSGSRSTNYNDRFGWSVDINSTGDRVVIGAMLDESQQPIVDADNQGVAYIFISGASGWTEQSVLTGSLTNNSDNFGYSVAFNSAGDRVVIGSLNDERTSGEAHTGLAYVFVSGNGGWSEQHILSGSLATNSSDRFGYSVTMNSAGDHIAIAASNDEKIGSNNTGLVYIYSSGSGGWVEKQILSGSEYIGDSVSINSVGDKIAVGEKYGSGIVYVFEGKE